MTPATSYAHIEMRDGVPYIQGTRTKVAMVALDEVAHGWDAAEIHEQYPYLSLGQIHSALAYYHDHREEMDRVIDEGYRRTEELRAAATNQATRKELESRLGKRQEAKPAV